VVAAGGIVVEVVVTEGAELFGEEDATVVVVVVVAELVVVVPVGSAAGVFCESKAATAGLVASLVAEAVAVAVVAGAGGAVNFEGDVGAAVGIVSSRNSSPRISAYSTRTVCFSPMNCQQASNLTKHLGHYQLPVTSLRIYTDCRL
jgi:hypothetical protein